MVIAMHVVSFLLAGAVFGCVVLAILWQQDSRSHEIADLRCRDLNVENAALRKQIEGHCERIAAASAVIGRNAERSPLAKLQEWLAAGNGTRKPFIDYEPFGWVVELHESPAVPAMVYGWPNCGGEVSPNELHLHEGADLGECLTAALELWAALNQRVCE